MTVKIVQTVTTCRACPNRSYYSGGVYECTKVERPLSPDCMIPEWCPLGGYPQGADARDAARIPDVLFDGYAVLQALDERARTRTSAENVSDVLDAVVRLLRAEVSSVSSGVVPQQPVAAGVAIPDGTHRSEGSDA